MLINTAPEKSEKSDLIHRSKSIANGLTLILISAVTSLCAQDLARWMELRYSFDSPEQPVVNYSELTNIARDITSLTRNLRHEHLTHFLRKHSVRHVYGIAAFKTVYSDITDSTLALAALLTGLQESYLDKLDQAGAGRLSVLQAMNCGLRIDAFVDERYNLPENLTCLQAWIRKGSGSIKVLSAEVLADITSAQKETFGHIYDLLLKYFSAIQKLDKPILNSVVQKEHAFSVSKSQWIVLRNDLRKIETLNPAIRTQIIPAGYPIRIPKDVTEFNTPIEHKIYEYKSDSQHSAISSQTKHVVKRGETLTQIAKKFGITVNELMSANQLKSDRISEGQTLVIPPKK